LLFGALAWRFFQPQDCGAKALFLKHYAERLASPTGLLGLSVLQQMSLIQTILEEKLWLNLFVEPRQCGVRATVTIRHAQ
jgi:hypothetical protein